jgi:hypothetical protein
MEDIIGFHRDCRASPPHRLAPAKSPFGVPPPINALNSLSPLIAVFFVRPSAPNTMGDAHA